MNNKEKIDQFLEKLLKEKDPIIQTEINLKLEFLEKELLKKLNYLKTK